MLVLLAAVATGAMAQTTYKVSVKEGTEDATSWTIAPAEATTTGVAAGTEVKATYSGTKKVKSVKAKKKANIVNLSTLEGDYVAQNGDVLTGTLNGSEKPYKISIADGATVTLDNATINGVAGWAYDPMMAEKGEYDGYYEWCGLTCEGDATIILKDGTENAVKGFLMIYPGIYVPVNKTLTIKGGAAGNGKLTAQNGTRGHSSGTGAGIGAGEGLSCGHINIQGGEITATGQGDSAGIGGANNGNCGNITISGGKINATGDANAAGIGGGAFMSCGDITIESTVISVTATSGSSNACSIGKGYNGSCGTVTIGGTVYADGVATSPFTYPSAP